MLPAHERGDVNQLDDYSQVHVVESDLASRPPASACAKTFAAAAHCIQAM